MSNPRPERRASGVVAIILAVVAGAGVPRAHVAASSQSVSRVAVFPVENLSGGTIPSEQLRQFLIARLVSERVDVLGLRALDEFMTRHRVRYAAGIDTSTAAALRTDTGVQAVLIASVELVSETVPPKIALVARLVSTDGTPAVAWADDAAISGDDAPGMLDLGLVNDYAALEGRALKRIGDSLAEYVRSGTRSFARVSAKYRPGTVYRALSLEPGRTYSVAVVPFSNLTDRRNAGDILALLFMRHLSDITQFRVVDAGVVRRQLLDARIIMDGGISLSDADTVAALIDADFVLGGRVLRFEGAGGSAGAGRVEFSTVLIERKNRKVVWSSDSETAASGGLGLFEHAGPTTAHAVATQMVRCAAASIAGRDR